MLAAIEAAIVARLKDKAPDIVYNDSAASTPIIAKAGSYRLRIWKGPAEQVTSDAFRQFANIALEVAFYNLQSDARRRQGVFPVVEAVSQLLFLEKLGLDIKGMTYSGFTEVTADEERIAGIEVYQLDFSTSYVVKKLDEEAAADLLKIGLTFLLGEKEVLDGEVNLEGGTE